MKGSALLSRYAAVQATPVESETFLVDADGNQIYHLDSMATALWRALETPRQLDELLGLFATAFPDVDPQRIRDDLETSIAKLVALGFVIAHA